MSDESRGATRRRPAIDVSGHRLELQPDGGLFLDSFEAAVEAATRRVWVECYIVVDDPLGKWLGQRLAAAAARGVDVRLLYDPLGSQKAHDSFFAKLREQGVKVHAYWAHHRFMPRFAPFPRDHGRVIVVDDVAFTGGAAWAKEWLPGARGGGDWYDVCVEVAGPIVAEFAELFGLRWSEAAGERNGPNDFDSEDRHPTLRLMGDTPSRVSLVCEEHIDRIRRAQRRVWLANAYFFPPKVLLAELYRAAARGVDVRIIVPKDSDLPIVRRAARARFADWLDGGLGLYEYAGRMMHAKYGVIDDDWCTVGSFNALPISVGLANEVNLFCCAGEFVTEVAAQFERDIDCCERVSLTKIKARSFATRLVDRLAASALSLADWIWGPRRSGR